MNLSPPHPVCVTGGAPTGEQTGWTITLPACRTVPLSPMLDPWRPAIGRPASQPTGIAFPTGKPATHSGTTGLREVAGYAATLPFLFPCPLTLGLLANRPSLPAVMRGMVDAVSSDTLDALLGLREHVSIAHHVRGRIRLRVAATALRDAAPLNRKQLEQALQAIDGIDAVRVNLIAGSVVVEYAPHRITPDTWVLLLKGDRTEARIRLRSLLGPGLESVVSAPRDTNFHRSSDKEHV